MSSDIHTLCHYYNLEAGARGLQHWAYARGEGAMIVKHYEGVKLVDRFELMDALSELQEARKAQA